MRIQKTIDLELRTPNLSKVRAFAHRWLFPNPGTLILMVVLALAVPALADPQSPQATSTSTISYQGRLADSAGNPLTGHYNLEFRIYDVPDGGVPLWEEFWTGGNSIQVSDGLFNVMLGSIDGTLASAIEGHDQLYLGVTVGTDAEMVPRVQLGSVPFSMQAMTVPDGSITTSKLAADSTAQVRWVGSDTEATLSTTGWENVPDMVVNLTTEGGPVVIRFHTNFTRSVADGAGVVVRFSIDGGDIEAAVAIERPALPDEPESLDLTYVTDLAPGAHTIRVRWRMSSVNPTGSLTSVGHRQLSVVEVKR